MRKRTRQVKTETKLNEAPSNELANVTQCPEKWSETEKPREPQHGNSWQTSRGMELSLDMEQQTGSKQGKEYVKAVYCHPAYLTSMQTRS